MNRWFIHIDAQDAQDFLSISFQMPGIRKIAPDHRLSRLLVQEALVLLILCILCIDVQSSCSRQAMHFSCFTLE